jgi:hypothetical protein
MRENFLEKEDENGMECEVCHKKKLSVFYRCNAYANDVGNDLYAMHTVCDECDYQNCMDI